MKNSPLKWQSPSQIWRVKQQNHSFFANCSNCTLNSHYSLLLLDTLPIHLPLDSTAPFDRPSAAFEKSFILSLCLTITTASLSDPVQNTTPEGILSLCWCSLTLTHTLRQWVYGIVRVPRDLDCTLLVDRSLLPRSKQVSTQPKFSIWMRRETLRDDIQIRLKDTKSYPDERKGVVPWNSDPLLYNCPAFVDVLWFLINCIKNLSISLFFCAKVDSGCSWFVVQNWQIPSRNSNFLLIIEA